jgi:hypothetical protein
VWGVNYFVNLGAECHFPKDVESLVFPKKWGASVIYPILLVDFV